MKGFIKNKQDNFEESPKEMKKSSKRMKKVMKVVAVITAFVVVAGAIFGIAGSVTNTRINNENTITMAKIVNTLDTSARYNAQEVVNTVKKDSFERNYYTNDQYYNLTDMTLDRDFFNMASREEYRNFNVFYNLVKYKNITICIDPSVPSERKSLIREAISYLNNIFHTIDPDITIKETNSVIDNPTCFHIKDVQADSSIENGVLGNTHISYEGDADFNKAIEIELFPERMSSYKHNNDYFKAAYKTVAIHEICHALGFPHISEFLDDAGRFNTGITYNELNRPLMSRGIGSTPNDRLCPYEIAGMFGLLNRDKYNSLYAKADKTEFYKVLNEDYQKYLNLVKMSLDQSRGYKMNNLTSASSLDQDQIVQLYYEDKIDNKNCEVLLTLNYPYVGFYQKEIFYEDESSHTFFAPFVTTNDGEGNCKYSLMSEDLKHFDNCNVCLNGNTSTIIAENLTADEVKEKVKELDPNLGYYVVENGSYDNTFIYTTQNFWEQFLNKHTDNVLHYDEALFTLYQTSPKWLIQKMNGNTTAATEVTNELEKQTDESNQRG